ncbi:MAG TPA: asparagine synthase (glutamine-hydrolyzing) [Chitinophagaceae bacterium]|nr:asparagine synthase (glutamine-hydrolyzing) [Chitinophagaceae bacterium]
MCGISGFICLQNTITPAQLKEATHLMAHRGPDAEGFYFSQDEKVGLGHRRLSILDLSANANQPMISGDGRYVIVFNGEIYNFNELKLQLNDKGTSLKTTSDTEVILQLFAQRGVDCFRELNGMFALAIYDTKKNIVTICRDHAGIKPLFIYCNGTELVFSSELKAIRAIKKHELSINKNSIPYFLHLGYIPHPLTIYNDTDKFPAAHYMQIDINSKNFRNVHSHFKPFWNLEACIGKEPLRNEAEAKKKLTGLLFDSVEKQLISDVPIGTFLSGGVDSSLVTAIASRVKHQKIKTFNIAIGEGRFNESKYASQVAKYLNTEHYQFNVAEAQVIELIGSILNVYDEPYADSSALPTRMVSRLARQYVTVTLTGDGGDELFMGYGMYAWAKRLSQAWVKPARHGLYTASLLMNDKYKRAGNLFDYRSKANIKSHIFSQEQYFFKEKELDKLLVTEKYDFGSLNAEEKIDRILTAEELQTLWDFNYYLPDDLLVKVDRASMFSSLEARVPLLDYRIIEFAFNLHRDLRMNDKITKYLLKQILFGMVPKDIFERPKQGFSLPLNKWLKGELKWWLEEAGTL